MKKLPSWSRCPKGLRKPISNWTSDWTQGESNWHNLQTCKWNEAMYTHFLKLLLLRKNAGLQPSPKAIELLTGQGKEGKNGPQRKISNGTWQEPVLVPELFNISRNYWKKVVVSERTRFWYIIISSTKDENQQIAERPNTDQCNKIVNEIQGGEI